MRPCVCSLTYLFTVWGYWVERRPNWHAEAGKTMCGSRIKAFQKNENILNSPAAAIHKNTRNAAGSSKKVVQLRTLGLNPSLKDASRAFARPWWMEGQKCRRVIIRKIERSPLAARRPRQWRMGFGTPGTPLALCYDNTKTFENCI